VLAADFSYDGRYVLTGSADTTARLWEVETGELIHIFEGHTSSIQITDFSPDGRFVLTSGDEPLDNENVGTILWDIESGDLVHIFDGPYGAGVISAGFSLDGRFILIGYFGGAAELWDVETGQHIQSLDGHSEHVLSIAFSPDGNYALTGSLDNTARLWDLETGQLIHILEGHTGEVPSVAFSPNGHYMLTGSVDRTLRLWEVDTGTLVRVFEEESQIRRTFFSPDGRYVLTNNGNLWGVDSAVIVYTLPNEDGQTRTLGLSPDGRYGLIAGAYSLLSSTNDPTAEIRFIGTIEESIDIVCEFPVVARDLTDEERRDFGITDDEPTCPKFGESAS
jgi:WD40 repeat protein